MDFVDDTQLFEVERPRLLRIATRVLNDPVEAEDVVQASWVRLQNTDSDVQSMPAWLTTVTTRICLDRLRSRTPEPVAEITTEQVVPDPAEDVALAETVGVALQVVLDRLSPSERVAFVLHDSFGFDFATIAAVLDTTPVAARKLASRARSKIGQPAAEDHLADWEVVDAFMTAAREGDFDKLLHLLAPQATVAADPAAVLLGTPEQIHGRHDVAAFFNGSAHAALSVFAGDRPAAAWYDRGKAKVLFDFIVADGVVQRITFRAEPEVIARVVRRRGPARRN
ncbi:MAG TPA: sigma-70 family RNA polymerase sigma factor [Ornithinimicrobium sp.]|uniref:sigma-70 family RNA polymerase sigma factor n=1 Tax=Ornithinimicrobium sp. TaxID=1977084 RepID=UPI002B4A3B85|nr:sigma-70 family RNA polymerase sigma factor [Ornithinimicrobium sp.]HKJ13187.1 sigma-70 family RNA polymerase sigma factor [Ornithinimicrobium sp.]